MFIFGFLVSIAIIGGSIVAGIFIVASGQLMLAIREIALNTRTHTIRRSYKALKAFAYILSFLGIFIIIGGLLIGVSGLIASYSTDEITRLHEFLTTQESKLERTPAEIEEITPPYIIITEPADLHRNDFQTKWPIAKIPAGTKLNMLDDHIWRSPSVDLEILFYRVKYKGISGWVIEDKCKLVTQ